MKKKIFGALVVVAIAVGAMINVNLNKTSNKGDLAMANVEALAEEYTVGNGGTNWKDYNVACMLTTTTTTTYYFKLGGSVTLPAGEFPVGVEANGGVVRTVTTTITTYYHKISCGYGSGFCLSSGSSSGGC